MNHKAPLVSVLIPCYNTELYFNEAINSIIGQTYRNLEILLIDDGSTDSTPDLMRKAAESDSRIRIVTNEQNMGLIRTLNKGVGLVTGEFIARMDADDISVPDRIEKLMAVFTSEPQVEVASAGFIYVGPSGNTLQVVYPRALHSRALKFVSFFSTPIIHACLLCRTPVLQANPYDPEFAHIEDYELFSRMLLKGVSFRNVNDCLYKIRVNPSSVSYRFESVQRETHRKISHRNISQYFGEVPGERVHRIMANRINFSVKSNDVTAAFSWFDKFRKIFIKQESPTQTELNEIARYLDLHIIDMLIQCVRLAPQKERLRMIPLIIAHSGVYLKPWSIRYLLAKFNYKYKADRFTA